MRKRLNMPMQQTRMPGFYNDYNETNPVERRKIIEMIRKLRLKGLPIHGVGLQAHWSIDMEAKQTEQYNNCFKVLR